MTTRCEIAMIALATLCIAASLLFGGLMLVDSAAQSPRSVGRLPVNVHSVACDFDRLSPTTSS
jgi:hypothetical protein